jgi:hypothetical protein
LSLFKKYFATAIILLIVLVPILFIKLFILTHFPEKRPYCGNEFDMAFNRSMTIGSPDVCYSERFYNASNISNTALELDNYFGGHCNTKYGTTIQYTDYQRSCLKTYAFATGNCSYYLFSNVSKCYDELSRRATLN